MTEQDKIEPVEGQCGTCKFAAAFDFADSPSGPEDGVHCTSEAQAKILNQQNGVDWYMQEYNEYGFLSLWRLETLYALELAYIKELVYRHVSIFV
jgi:hypothetical protein